MTRFRVGNKMRGARIGKKKRKGGVGYVERGERHSSMCGRSACGGKKRGGGRRWLQKCRVISGRGSG